MNIIQLAGQAPQSYYQFMKRNLFDHIDIEPSNCFIQNGQCQREDIKRETAAYNAQIEMYGEN